MDSLIVDLDKVLDDFEAEGECLVTIVTRTSTYSSHHSYRVPLHTVVTIVTGNLYIQTVVTIVTRNLYIKYGDHSYNCR